MLNKHYYGGMQDLGYITGVPTNLLSVLDKCFVTGFNIINVISLTVSDDIATCTTSTPHGHILWEGSIGPVIRFSGSNNSLINNDFRIVSVPDTTHFTFSTSRNF